MDADERQQRRERLLTAAKAGHAKVKGSAAWDDLTLASQESTLDGMEAAAIAAGWEQPLPAPQAEVPRYKHDEKADWFLGQFKEFDLYCRPPGEPTFMARWHDRPHSYHSSAKVGNDHVIDEARRRAIAAGLIAGEGTDGPDDPRREIITDALFKKKFPCQHKEDWPGGVKDCESDAIAVLQALDARGMTPGGKPPAESPAEDPAWRAGEIEKAAKAAWNKTASAGCQWEHVTECGKGEERPMGQGFYTVFAFGAVHDFDNGESGEALYSWVHDAAKKHGIQGRTRYEAKDNWFGFFIAENGSGISRDGDGCELFSYEVFDLSSLASSVRQRWPLQCQKCEDAYETLRETAAKYGVTLPYGRMMLVNDYD